MVSSEPRADLIALDDALKSLASIPRLIDAILHQAPQSPCVLSQQVSPGLEGFILKCLEKAPNLRYQTAGELRADLERVAASASVAARQDRWARLWWAMGVAGILVALLAGAVGLNVGGLRARLGRGTAEVRIRSLAVLCGRTYPRNAQRVSCSVSTEGTWWHCTDLLRRREQRLMRIWHWPVGVRRSWSNEQETYGFEHRRFPQGGRHF